MPHAIRIHETGGAEVLRWEAIEPGKPGPGMLRIRQTAIGLNFIDVYHRTGLYKLELPAILGSEGAGVVEETGPGVTGFSPGDRVAYPLEAGAYTEARLVRAERVVPIPDGVSDQQAAAVLLKGLTAHYLIRRTYRVQAGETILAHAAAGGVGLILCQWAKHLGATVIGTVGSQEKAKLARAHGCDHPILYRQEDFVAKVLEITGGEKLPVVYDSVGKETFFKSLDCLRSLGLMVSFGQSSGAIGPVDLAILASKGSLFLTRPTLGTYVARTDDLRSAAGELFSVIASGAVRIEIGQTYPLREAARAHQDLEARKTTGSTVLLP